MKTLQAIKDEVAKANRFKDWEDVVLQFQSKNYVDTVAELYAEQCKHSREKHAETYQPLLDSYDRLQGTTSSLREEIERLNKELAEIKENYEGMKGHCKYLTEIHVFNMAFDDANSDWKKQHSVKDGETFIDWYMRYHAAERKSDQAMICRLREEIERLKANQKELVEALKELQDCSMSTAAKSIVKEALSSVSKLSPRASKD